MFMPRVVSLSLSISPSPVAMATVMQPLWSVFMVNFVFSLSARVPINLRGLFSQGSSNCLIDSIYI